ncbi:unnamed protein product [Rotaria magnacalcarata]|uniref:Uncharacterized protein n=1 Tax=Rotaria magnacalcarata TaxID=392030 RepID=A0A8S2QGL7_9BILA|nr:unnamed protein product [Rotaria magnacalcarata]CAF4292526.1 unnamed protein product [Rotaria magnacalcarata]
MAFQANRFYNPKDGTYANVPIIPIHTEKFRGKRQFGTDVLIGNCEYADRYIPHESKLYAESTRVAIPRLFSTELDRTNAVNKDLNYRSITNSSRRQPTTRDAKEIDYLRSFQRDTNIPRTYYYLGKAADTVDDRMREKFPFLPAPINSLQQIKSSTIEKLPNQQEQSVYAQ